MEVTGRQLETAGQLTLRDDRIIATLRCPVVGKTVAIRESDRDGDVTVCPGCGRRFNEKAAMKGV